MAMNLTTPNKENRLKFINPMVRYQSTTERSPIDLRGLSFKANQTQASHEASCFKYVIYVFINNFFNKMDNNSYMKRVNGNIAHKLGVKFSTWNSQKGLIEDNMEPSTKGEDIRIFLETHGVDIVAVIEAGLHGLLSRTKRRRPLSTADIMSILHLMVSSPTG